jgi:hypothetical protein
MFAPAENHVVVVPISEIEGELKVVATCCLEDEEENIIREGTMVVD